LPRFQTTFILIKVAPGHEREVADDLMKINEVKEVHIVPGEWDIVAVVSSEREIVIPSDEKIYKIVLDKVNKIKHIQDTSTLVSQFSKTK
jgi:DNA-binding Lrp family transcriptional regulator